jgi:GNAT superfamily N-acetyltransferase
MVADRFRDAPKVNLYLGAFEGGKLIGMATFVRETGLKETHKERIYGVYVSAEFRRRGIGRTLLARIFEAVRRDRQPSPQCLDRSFQTMAGRLAFNKTYSYVIVDRQNRLVVPN